MHPSQNKQQQLFELISFNVYCTTKQIEKTQKLCSHSLATVKIKVPKVGEMLEILSIGEGNGPVSALDTALRKALVKFYPAITKFHLADYQVEILEGHNGTSAKTRVLVEFRTKSCCWKTEGISDSVVEASYQAIVEGLEYGWFIH